MYEIRYWNNKYSQNSEQTAHAHLLTHKHNRLKASKAKKELEQSSTYSPDDDFDTAKRHKKRTRQSTNGVNARALAENAKNMHNYYYNNNFYFYNSRHHTGDAQPMLATPRPHYVAHRTCTLLQQTFIRARIRAWRSIYTYLPYIYLFVCLLFMKGKGTEGTEKPNVLQICLHTLHYYYFSSVQLVLFRVCIYNLHSTPMLWSGTTMGVGCE